MEDEKFGIEDFKKVLKLYGDLKKWYETSNADGKITMDEYFQLVSQANAIQDIVQSREAVIEQAKDLSLAEVQELKPALEALGNPDVVRVATVVLNFVVSAKDLIELIIESRKPDVDAQV